MPVKLIPSESKRSILKEWLHTDPLDRDSALIPQVLEELNELTFFRQTLLEISRDNADNLCKNITLMNIKKKRIEPCTRSFQIILEGKISACLESCEEDTEQTKQQQKDKLMSTEKQHLHSFQRGDCFNMVLVWSQKPLSFYFESEEATQLIDVPLEKGGQSLLESFKRRTNENYAFLLATLSKHDNHLTQQKARDILLISTQKKYSKGETLLKKDGMVVFIKSGEFSVFKEISKHKEPAEIQSSHRLPLAYSEVESESVGDLRVKKAASLKRVHLGIKRHDSLIELSLSDDAIDGIECFTNDGEILICSQEAYQKIQENQEKRIFGGKDHSVMKPKEFKSNRLSQQLLPRTPMEEQRSISVQRRQVQRKLCPFFEEWNKNEQRKSSKHDMLFQQFLAEEVHSEKIIENKPSQRESQVAGLVEAEEFKKQQISKNSSISKQEANYRQSLLTTIGQQMNAYGDFLYASNTKNNLLRNNTNMSKFPNQKKFLNEKEMKLPTSTPLQQENQKLQELIESNFAASSGRKQSSKMTGGLCKNPMFNQDLNFIRGSSVDSRDQGKPVKMNNFTSSMNQDILPNVQTRSKAASQSSLQSKLFAENPSEISPSQDKMPNTSRPTTTTISHGFLDMQSPLKVQRKLSDGSPLQTLSIDIGKVKKCFENDNYNIIGGSKTSRQCKKDELLNDYKVIVNPNLETTGSLKQNSTSNNTPKSGYKSDLNSPLSSSSRQSPLCYENFSSFYNSNNRNKSIGRSIHFVKQEDSQLQLPGDNSPGSCTSPVNFSSFSSKPSSFSKQLLRESLMKRTQQRMSSQTLLNQQNTSEITQEAVVQNNSDKNLKEPDSLLPQSSTATNLDMFTLPQKRNSSNSLLPISAIVYPTGNISRLKGTMSVQNSPIRVFSEIRARK